MTGAPGRGLRVLVVGMGSAGARHARELLALGAEVHGHDPSEDRARSVDGVVAHRRGLDEAGDFDGVVIATPSGLHDAHVERALEGRAYLLVEKPLAVSTDRLQAIVERGAGRVMVGFNLRFHEPTRRVVSMVREGRAGRPLAARLWSGSFLPEWRPGVDYRTVYSSSSKLGGGILADASHELDLLAWMAPPGRFQVAGAAFSNSGTLEIDVEDMVRAVLIHDSGLIGELSLDYLSRGYRRGIEVIGDKGTVRLDWARKVLEVEDSAGSVSEEVAEPVALSYARQALHFCEWIRGAADPPVDEASGAALVEIAEAIRSSATWAAPVPGA